MDQRDRPPPRGRQASRHGPAGHRLPHPRPRALGWDEAAPGSYHHGERARALLREGMARHGCATTRQLAEKLGVPHGPGPLTAIGYRGNAPAAWRDLAPELAGEPDRPGADDAGRPADDARQGA